ncbi:MAG: aconitate hydratase [Deltaproteobacteria bacterium]|nr:MAG: aconitate hydratase [Deltaproteobacteria bacterium]
MATTVTEQIINAHLVCGPAVPGEEIALKIDQTLTQDATGTLAYLEFESLGVPRVRTQASVSYVDHNLLQADFKNADDHRFLQSIAARYGINFSPPGNGICHQVHLERFSVPGQTLLGSDSHTPTAGGAGMLAIGAGGLDVALAMAGQPFNLVMPEIIGIRLTGKLPPWVSAKDVILALLRRLTVKGGVGKIMEYFGPGVVNLTVSERATIANMGAELGATTSVFPADRQTQRFLALQGRAASFRPLRARGTKGFGQILELDMETLTPRIACPSSPDKVKEVREVEGTPVHQVIIGSCSNSSYRDLMVVAQALQGRQVHPQVSLEINPGSRQVLENVALAGGLLTLLQAGARIHQPGCLGCIGMGQAPATATVSIRTFPRNFPGRSGTKDDQVYLASPETAVAAAIFGEIADPRRLGDFPRIAPPRRYLVNSGQIQTPKPEAPAGEIVRGPNIRPFPELTPLPESWTGEVLLTVGDHVTTDQIMPAGGQILPLRSNIPAISEYVFAAIDAEFPRRARETGEGAIIGGENYGQGSSREHAALAPRYLGVRVKLAKSFARIHQANLINFGILPLIFENPADYERLTVGTRLHLPELRRRLLAGEERLPLQVDDDTVWVRVDMSDRQRRIIVSGGLLNLTREEYHKNPNSNSSLFRAQVPLGNDLK